MRKKLAVLVAMALMLVFAASPAWAAPGGKGQGIGGGNFVNPDNGQHTATGGGQLNNPHLCDICR